MDEAQFDAEVANLFNEDFAKQLRELLRAGPKDTASSVSVPVNLSAKMRCFSFVDNRYRQPRTRGLLSTDFWIDISRKSALCLYARTESSRSVGRSIPKN